MTPKTLKAWEFVKDKKHDLSSLLRLQQSPEMFYYQFNNGIYYPAVSKTDIDNLPEPSPYSGKFR